MTKTKPWHAALHILSTIALTAGSTAAARAEYPERQVRIVVPVAAGGGVDVMARLLAQRLGERLVPVEDLVRWQMKSNRMMLRSDEGYL